MPKKSRPKKKIEIIEETPKQSYHQEQADALALERSMYDRHPEMFDQRKEPLVRGTMSYPISYIRSDSKQKSRILKIIYRDTPLELLSEDEAGWTKVQTLDEPKVQGYTKSALIKKTE